MIRKSERRGCMLAICQEDHKMVGMHASSHHMQDATPFLMEIRCIYTSIHKHTLSLYISQTHTHILHCFLHDLAFTFPAQSTQCEAPTPRPSSKASSRTWSWVSKPAANSASHPLPLGAQPWWVSSRGSAPSSRRPTSPWRLPAVVGRGGRRPSWLRVRRRLGGRASRRRRRGRRRTRACARRSWGGVSTQGGDREVALAPPRRLQGRGRPWSVAGRLQKGWWGRGPRCWGRCYLAASCSMRSRCFMRLWTTLLIYTRKSTSSGASQMRCNEVEILCTRLVFWVFVLSLLFFQWTDTKVIYSRFCMKARQWINPTFNTHISVSYRNSFCVFVFFAPTQHAEVSGQFNLQEKNNGW